jgi:hypothetical protein
MLRETILIRGLIHLLVYFRVFLRPTKLNYKNIRLQKMQAVRTVRGESHRGALVAVDVKVIDLIFQNIQTNLIQLVNLNFLWKSRKKVLILLQNPVWIKKLKKGSII